MLGSAALTLADDGVRASAADGEAVVVASRVGSGYFGISGDGGRFVYRGSTRADPGLYVRDPGTPGIRVARESSSLPTITRDGKTVYYSRWIDRGTIRLMRYTVATRRAVMIPGQ